MPRARLVIPARITVTTLVAFAASCSPSPAPSDAMTDALADALADSLGDVLDDAAADAHHDARADVCNPVSFERGYFACLRGAGTPADRCNGALVCAAADCAAGCEACPTGESFEPGFACVADPRADASGAACGGRVCRQEHCPAGCVACRSTLFCIPDSEADVRVERCEPPVVCDPTACQLGCRAVA